MLSWFIGFVTRKYAIKHSINCCNYSNVFNINYHGDNVIEIVMTYASKLSWV